MVSIKFYTLPPRTIDWPYILININRPDIGLRYLANHKKQVKSVIIDSGIEVFRDPRIKEYPEGRIGRIRKAVRYYAEVKSICPSAEVYVTAPDYCDDYIEHWGRPHNLWIDGKTNIDRTIENIKYAIDNYPKTPWLIPIQGFYMQPKSIIFSIQRLEEMGVFNKYKYVAVANLCTTRSVNIIRRTLTIARTRLPLDVKIHSFGLSMNAIAKVCGKIHSTDSTTCILNSLNHHWAEYLVPRAISLLNSTDSTAWTRPTKLAYEKYLKVLGRKRASRKSLKDSEVYFWAWVYTLTHKYGVMIEGINSEVVKEKFLETLNKHI